MNLSATRGLLAAALALATVGAAVAGDSYSPRQYYGGYQRHASANYYYRSYYYKPTPTYVGYQHHYCIYYPSRPKMLYFYNPYKKVFWGGCDSHYDGYKPTYSLLAEADRKSSLAEIPDSAFPTPGALPSIPESQDGATLELPPDDLPTVAAGPAAAGIPTPPSPPQQ